MKNNTLLFWLFCVSAILLLAPSCSKDACDGVVCQNGGNCVEGNCECPPGFSGASCEIKDLCFGVTCQNGGNCVDGTCDCPPGFSGVSCEIEDLCFNVTCENGGTCIDGICDCPEDYVGANCENLDPSKVQTFLDDGRTPLELFNANIPMDSLYGKRYNGGFIFYLDTLDGSGMVAAFQDQSDDVEWGCRIIDLPWLSNVQVSQNNLNELPGARIGDGASNTDKILEQGCVSETGRDIAAKVCRDLGPEWFLPSKAELNLMHSNLVLKGYGFFTENTYWSSSESDARYSWGHYLGNNTPNEGAWLQEKDNGNPVRAAKAF